MEKMKEKFLRKYRLPEATFLEFLSHMTEHHYSKGEIIVRTGEHNSNLYLIREGIWRAHYLVDGTETSLWFVTAGEVVFSSWGYVNNEPSMATIESVNESSAYMISKADLEQLFSSSIQMQLRTSHFRAGDRERRQLHHRLRHPKRQGALSGPLGGESGIAPGCSPETSGLIPLHHAPITEPHSCRIKEEAIREE